MKKTNLTGIICSAILFVSCQSPEYFKDAVAAWSFSDLNDQTEINSPLASHGEIHYITLDSQEAKASVTRGGDGKAIRLKNSSLNAGQGIGEKLNLTGKNISILARIKAEEITNGSLPILNKDGNDQSISYSLSLNAIDNETYIEVKIGSDEIGGAHLLKYKLTKEEYTEWHDILFRFNGKTSELYIDGILRDDEVTVGEIRDWNRQPLLIGTNPSGEQFNGLIDHIVLWNRYLTNEEIQKYSGVTSLKDGRPDYYQETYRPQFHFSAKKNWLNDPNGLVYYNGIYHLFFQYMPPHRPGAYKDWGHATSTDLVHWTQIPNHITPHKVWSGCWSGSAIVDENNVAGFQEGDEKTIVAFITNGGDPGRGLGPLCTQCIAYSTDGGYTFNYYDQNPVINNIHNANRDPKVVWDEDSQKWIMSLYMDEPNKFGLFSSSNLKEWKYLSTVLLEGVSECPGFCPLPVDGDKKNKKWLFFGANGNYRIGSFDGTNFIPETNVLQGDYGMNFYAAQTWSNSPDGKCYHIAWMPTKRLPGMPFEQQMNFPTEVTLRTTANGIQMYRMPVSGISSLYEKRESWNNRTIKKGDNPFQEMNGELYDINLEIAMQQASSLDIGIRGAVIHYDAAKKSIKCGSPSIDEQTLSQNWWSPKRINITSSNNMGEAPLSPENGKIKLRILVDRTTIEIFGNDGQIVITSCFLPEKDNKSYSLTSNGEILLVNAEVHSLKSAWAN